MGSKLFVLFLFCGVTLSMSGEKKLTGNISWDLLRSDQDTITAAPSVQIASDQKQNPFMNGLYSLVLPGSGQYHSERYTKAVVFLCAEIALVTYAVVNNNRGDKKTAEFQTYAESHWSPERYAKWINTYGAIDYGPGASIDLNKVRQYDFSEINEWERGQHKLGFSHQLPKFGEQQYYELIGKYNQFKYGWSEYPLDINGVPKSDGGTTLGYDSNIPQQLKNYAVDRGKANDYYYAASFAVSALVINHVVSAVDAFLSTKSFNNELSASLNLKPVDGIEGKRLLSELTVCVGL